MTVPLTLLVSEEAEAMRLDKFLAVELEDTVSRERVKALILEGRATVNGKPALRPATRLAEGDSVALLIPEAQPIALAAEPIALAVLYEDADVLVLNKPRGMLTHPAGGQVTGTLVNALLHHCGDSLSGINGALRPGIVHRLDRDTSGLLMVAKTERAHRHLSDQLKAKTARREYRAIVQGVPAQAQGTVVAPIGRNPRHRDRMAVTPEGRPAVTHWQVVEPVHGRCCAVQLRLETGRTHQIRVHMAHIGHPVLGDPLYGTNFARQLKLPEQGQLLQAFRLGFVHPATGEFRVFEIPEEPALTEAMALLRRPG